MLATSSTAITMLKIAAPGAGCCSTAREGHSETGPGQDDSRSVADVNTTSMIAIFADRGASGAGHNHRDGAQGDDQPAFGLIALQRRAACQDSVSELPPRRIVASARRPTALADLPGKPEHVGRANATFERRLGSSPEIVRRWQRTPKDPRLDGTQHAPRSPHLRRRHIAARATPFRN